MGEGAFTRVVAAPSNWTDYLGEAPNDPRKDKAAANIQRALESLEMEPEVAAEIASMDPDGYYAVTFTVARYHGSRALQSIGPFVGSTRSLWDRAIWISSDGDIIAVTFEPLMPFKKGYRGSYALWSEESVATADGMRFDGLGDYVAWQKKIEERMKLGGRPKKKHGRRTHAEGTKIDRAEAKAKSRAEKTQARIQALKDAGFNLRAKQLEKRSLRGKGKGR